MSARDIQQLVDMGATPAQARRALQDGYDVNDAAERIFDGKYDEVEDEDEEMQDAPIGREVRRESRIETPPTEGDADEEELVDEEEEEDFVDYDSEPEMDPNRRADGSGVDPYAGIFFSKDRREEVIEVEETPEFTQLADKTLVPIMTQGEWMKGCPEGGEQGLLFQLYSQLSNESCFCPNRCGYQVKRDKAMFFALRPQFSDYIDNLRSKVQHRCPKCATDFCLACGERVDHEKSLAPNYDTLFHCPNLQGVILGVGLAKLELVYNEQTTVSRTISPDGDGSNKKKRKVATVNIPDDDEDDVMTMYGHGVPKGKKAKGGTGYAGSLKEDTSGQAEALAAQQMRDAEIGNLMHDIRIFLPSPARAGAKTSDYLVHPTALAHLRRRFNSVGSSLLRNDSLSDMSDRSVLYFELFEWLEIISNHEALASMMAMPIMIATSTSPLRPQANSGSSKRGARAGPAPRERTIVYEGSSGPRELMESIVIQAQAAIKGLGQLPETPSLDVRPMTEEEKRQSPLADEDSKGKGKASAVEANYDNMRLRTFCERILSTAAAVDRSLRETKGSAFVDRLQANLPKIPSVAPPRDSEPTPGDPEDFSTIYDDIPVGPTDKDTEKAYVVWASRVRFEYCDLTIPAPPNTEVKPGEDLTPSYRHVYNTEIRMLANADIPKRSLAIAKELAVLTTNLPIAWDSSVFLRVDETRVDVIKALIIGPEGTPYQNGCYLFDIFLGPNYNQGPPTVKYITTGGGKYRFNPNLYNDGKVCLSLLGTWQGPGWISGKSTLLQVLISIQSMILTDEPYLNEPAWAESSGTPQSMAYSANVRRMVVQTAMLGNLKAPPEPFRDIIFTHFRLKATSIGQQLDKWLVMDDGKPTDGRNGGDYFNIPIPAGSSSAGFRKDIAELKKLLKVLSSKGTSAKGGRKPRDAIEVDVDDP